MDEQDRRHGLELVRELGPGFGAGAGVEALRGDAGGVGARSSGMSNAVVVQAIRNVERRRDKDGELRQAWAAVERKLKSNISRPDP